MKEILLRNGLNEKVDDEDYEWLSRYSRYAYSDSLWALIHWKTNVP